MHDNQNQESFDVPAPANPAANRFVHELLEKGSVSQFRKRPERVRSPTCLALTNCKSAFDLRRPDPQ
jgi:hypothetical protein